VHYTAVTADEFAALPGLDDWRLLTTAIHAQFRAGSYAAAAGLLPAIAAAADAIEHHPDVDLRYPGVVRVVLKTHATGGVTTLDTDLARTISALAAEAGATAQPLVSGVVEVAIDTTDADRIRPFWVAVLGYGVDASGQAVDPMRCSPTVWFQPMDPARTERSRLHIDVYVPHDVAAERIAAALAAGGRLVTDRFAPAWWVLADPDGNEACICTWQS